MKKNIMNTLFALILSVVAISSHAQDSTGSSPKDEIGKIAMKICPNNGSTYDYYISKTAVRNPSVNGKTIEGNYWLAFVDMEPQANWDHKCKYIYIKYGEETKTDGTVYIENSKRPPLGIKMDAYKLSSSNSHKQAKVKKSASKIALQANTQSGNEFAQNTYAVIISGGANPEENYLRYWNDCAFIFSTLTEMYDVPKSNIKVAMAAGKTDEANQNYNTSYSPELKPTDFDLDGDGTDDIEYAANTQSLEAIFNDLKQKLTDKDHLFVFVTDHGGKNETNDSSFIYLWNNYQLYPRKFASYLNGIDAGYITVVLGQCFAGGFVDDLKADNRIIMTACAADESSYAMEKHPFDEFLYHFSSALYGSDPYGNKKGDADVKDRTMKYAFDFAKKSDWHFYSKYADGKETPSLTLLENTTAEELSLGRIPNTVELYIGAFPYEDATGEFWNSDNIWARYQNDAAWNETSQSEKGKLAKYGALRISNRGVKPYLGSGKKASMYWAKPYINTPVNNWRTKEKSYECFDSHEIKETIAPRETKTVYMNANSEAEKNFTDRLFYNSYTYFANISSMNQNVFGRPSNTPYVDFTSAQKKSLACKNCVSVGNKSMICAPSESTTYRLEIAEDAENPKSIFDVAELSLQYTNITLNSDNGVVLSDNIFADKNDGKIINITGNSEIKNIPSTLNCYNIEGAIKANSATTEKAQYKIHTTLYDNSTNKCLGGMTYEMTCKRRPAITVELKTINEDGVVYLSAENPSENVSYEWYDASGTIIGNANKISRGSNCARLRLKAVSDGAIADFDCSSAKMSEENFSIDKTQGGYSISFKEPVSEKTTVRIASVGSMNVAKTYYIDEGEQQTDIPVENASHDGNIYYNISVYQKNVCIGNKKVK